MDSLENLQYDGNGNVTRHEEGGGANEHYCRIGTWQYDVFGNMTRHENGRTGRRQGGYQGTYQYDLTGISRAMIASPAPPVEIVDSIPGNMMPTEI